MLIITLNPSIDRTILVEEFLPGVEMRASSSRHIDGGKGVNLFRAFQALGGVAVSLTLRDMLPSVDVRVNMTVVDASGRSTRFIEPGPRLSHQVWGKVERQILGHLSGHDLIALCGSLPPGAPPNIYARLIEGARRKQVGAVLDSSGIALARGVKTGPWCVKPNREEAEKLLGMSIRSPRAVRKALQMLAGYGMTRVLLSLGEEGLAGLNGEKMMLAHPPYCAGVTVGCGDASLAGFLLAHGQGASFEDALSLAAAAGTANVGTRVAGQVSRAQVMALQKKIKLERL